MDPIATVDLARAFPRRAGRTTALVAALCCAPGTAAQAQTVVDFGLFGSDAAGLHGDGSHVLGVSLGVMPGPVGVRGSLGLDRDGGPRPDGWTPEQAASDWFVDVDGVVRVPLGSGLFEPFAFVGLGTEGISEVGGIRDGNLSWGLGLSLMPSHWFGVQLEGRNRHPLTAPDLQESGGGWQFRIGAALRVGSAPRPAPRGWTGARTTSTPHPPARRRANGVDDAERRRAAELYARLYGTAPPDVGEEGDAGAPAADLGGGPTYRPLTAAAAAVASSVIDHGDRLLGTRYLWGGSDRYRGFDCSGFVQTIYGAQGVDLPRVSRDQARAGYGIPLDFDEFAPGDLLFFASNGSWIDHVAVYVGDDTILHSSSSGGGVRYDRLDTPRGQWFVRHMVAARRVL